MDCEPQQREFSAPESPPLQATHHRKRISPIPAKQARRTTLPLVPMFLKGEAPLPSEVACILAFDQSFWRFEGDESELRSEDGERGVERVVGPGICSIV